MVRVARWALALVLGMLALIMAAFAGLLILGLVLATVSGQDPESAATSRPTPQPTADRSNEQEAAIGAVAYGELPTAPGLGRYKSIQMFIDVYSGMGDQITEIGFDAEWYQDANQEGWLVTYSFEQASESRTKRAEWYYSPSTGRVTARNETAQMFDQLQW